MATLAGITDAIFRNKTTRAWQGGGQATRAIRSNASLGLWRAMLPNTTI